MTRRNDWREMPVWSCPESATCGKQWASWETTSTCPFCHLGRGKLAGFSCGEAADAAEKFGFSELPVHIPEPVPELVPLSSLPMETWVGLPVFHPWTQDGEVPRWLMYDVGVVVEVCDDPDLPGEYRCRFVHSTGGNGTLQYGPDNLWVPRALAQRLRDG